jgi:hypothetical protein
MYMSQIECVHQHYHTHSSHLLYTGRWFSLGTPVSSTNKTDHHNITEILLKMALNTIKSTNQLLINHCINRGEILSSLIKKKWKSVLLVEETGVPRENHRPVASHWQTLSHNVVHLTLTGIQLTTSVVIGTDCID